MSVLASLPLLWSQLPVQKIPNWLRPTITWLFLFGEPNLSIPGLIGGLIIWLKVISLFCLLGWVLSWLKTAVKEGQVARRGVLDIAALVALLVGMLSVLLSVLQSTG